MGVTRKQIADGSISGRKLHASVRDQTYLYEKFQHTGIAQSAATTANPPTGAQGDSNYYQTRRQTLRYFIVGGASTVLNPSFDSINGGLIITLQPATGRGVEYVIGQHLSAFNPFAHVIGTSPDSFFRVRSRFGTLGNAAAVPAIVHYAVGWHKAETLKQLLDDYDEGAWLNVQAGVINRQTILNNAATVTTWTGRPPLTGTADAQFDLEVRLIGRNPQFYVNGVRADGAAAPHVFDKGEVLIPFVHFLRDAGAGPWATVYWWEMECGRMVDAYDSLVAK